MGNDCLSFPPDAVRVWFGYRSEECSRDEFRDRLSGTFIPATVQLMQPFGLAAYIPTLLTTGDDRLPDEIALVFYASRPAYQAIYRTPTGRAYGLLHWSSFSRRRSHSDFPLPLGADLLPKRPVHLFTRPADWQRSDVRVLVGARPASQAAPTFLEGVADVLSACRARDRLAGAICMGTDDCVAFWATADRDSLSGEPVFDDLASVCDDPRVDQRAVQHDLPLSATTPFAGFGLESPYTLNLQFLRIRAQEDLQ